jgi:hypothetical protein
MRVGVKFMPIPLTKGCPIALEIYWRFNTDTTLAVLIAAGVGCKTIKMA